MAVRIERLFIYADDLDVGQELDEVAVGPEGPEGDGDAAPDGHQRGPVLLTTTQHYVAEHPRAHVLLDMPTEALAEMLGKVLALGDEVRLQAVDWFAPGVVSADVAAGGRVRVGDTAAVVVVAPGRSVAKD